VPCFSWHHPRVIIWLGCFEPCPSPLVSPRRPPFPFEKEGRQGKRGPSYDRLSPIVT
jgi:hypothetical protein